MNPNDIYLSFDLDNTLINNHEGIINSFNYAMQQYAKETIPPNYIKRMIGMPLHEMFAKILNDSTDKYVDAFREYYGKIGIYQANLINGTKEKLEELKTIGFHMGLLSSKKHEMVVRIIDILGISKYFELSLGETKEQKKKYDPIVKSVLTKKLPGKKIVVIGDHINDVKVAEMLKCPFIGVLTGTTKKRKLKKGISVPCKILKSVKKLKPKTIYSLLKKG